MRHVEVTLFLGGDVMLGRGVDQALAHPGDPALVEPYVTDARTYLEMAERANGPVPRPVDDTWPWGDALAALTAAAPHVRVVNLETGVTARGLPVDGKVVHYRMHPSNLGCLISLRPDVCTLANNHVLDFGRPGLLDTLEALDAAGLGRAGAGRDLQEARRPAVVPLDDRSRVLVAAVGHASSGIPSGWAATAEGPGIAVVEELAADAGREVAAGLERHARTGDLRVVSVHWGPNWGYRPDDAEVEFAHALVDGGVDVVHGHSSHHPRPAEIYRDRLILYGCGDLVNDYEGISGHESYRPDLRLLYLVTLRTVDGALTSVRMLPMRARRLRLEHASGEDAGWLHARLDDAGAALGTRVARLDDGTLTLRRG